MVTVEWINSVDTTLTKWWRLMLQVIRHQHCVPLIWCTKKEHNVCRILVFLPIMHNLNLIKRRYQGNPNWGKSIKYMTINLQKVSRYKRQGLRNCNWKRFKEAWQMKHGILDCILEYSKAISGKTGEILWKSIIRLLIFYSCKLHFDNCTMAWRAAIHGVAKSRTRLSDWTELCQVLTLREAEWKVYRNSLLFLKLLCYSKVIWKWKVFFLSNFKCYLSRSCIALWLRM